MDESIFGNVVGSDCGLFDLIFFLEYGESDFCPKMVSNAKLKTFSPMSDCFEAVRSRFSKLFFVRSVSKRSSMSGIPLSSLREYQNLLIIENVCSSFPYSELWKMFQHLCEYSSYFCIGRMHKSSHMYTLDVVFQNHHIFEA